VDAGGASGSDGAATSQPDAASAVGGAGTGGGTNAGGSGGNSGGTTAGTTTAPSCTPDVTNLVTGKTRICDSDPSLTPNIEIQGSFYMYQDVSLSCVSANPLCSPGAGCCISGTTVVDPMLTRWGCGIGLGLNTSSGTSMVKSVYSGPVKCFDITLTGSSGGNEVRIGFTQSTAAAGKVSPFTSVAAFANGWSGRVCFTDAECPDWAVTAGTCAKAVGTAGTPYDMQIQVAAGSTPASVGAFNLCVSKIVPVIDQGSTDTTSSWDAGTPGDAGGTAGGVTFRAGQAQGAMSGWGWVDLGALDSITDPTCGVGKTNFTKSAPCASGVNWNSPSALCISGNIPALPASPLQADYDANLGLRIGVNANEISGFPIGKAYSSITVEVTGSPTAGLRVELHRAGDLENVTYCAYNTGSAMNLTSFNTACWDGSGIAFSAADAPLIDKVGVWVSSTKAAVTVSNLCINSVTFGT
jgi:hypothetical protein